MRNDLPEAPPHPDPALESPWTVATTFLPKRTHARCDAPRIMHPKHHGWIANLI